MRAPVISRFAATTVAALALGVGLPLLSGATPAFAVCGATPRPVPPVVLPVHQGKLDVTLGKVRSSITVGGPAVEFPVTITNHTDGAYKTVEPTIGLGHYFDNRHDLAIEDVKVARAVGGGWRKVGLQPGCTRGIVNDYDQLPMLALGKGESVELTFRVSMPAGAAKGIDPMSVSFGARAEDHTEGMAGADLTVVHPKAAPAPAQPAAPAAQAAPAAATSAPAATPSVAPSDTASATPTAPARLASTGPSKATGPLAAVGGVLIILGGVLVLTLRRSAR